MADEVLVSQSDHLELPLGEIALVSVQLIFVGFAVHVALCFRESMPLLDDFLVIVAIAQITAFRRGECFGQKAEEA